MIMLALDKVYVLAGTADLKKYGITKENNPLLYKDIMHSIRLPEMAQNFTCWWWMKPRN